jgi:hypothetical protein
MCLRLGLVMAEASPSGVLRLLLLTLTLTVLKLLLLLPLHLLQMHFLDLLHGR